MMMIGAVILVLIGAVGVVVGLLAKRRMDTMSGTATISCVDVESVAGEDSAVPCEVVGVAEPTQQPLIGPFSGTPCVWYRATVSRRYRERRRGNDGETRSVTRSTRVSQQESSEPFAIRDASGITSVLPDGAKVIGETETVDRFEPFLPHQRAQTSDAPLTQRAIAMGLNLLAQTRDSTIGYEYHEWILRAGSKLYVRAGAMRDHTGRAWLQKPANGPFLISTRSEADLTRKARLTMVVAFGIGAAAIVGGLVWGAVLLA